MAAVQGSHSCCKERLQDKIIPTHPSTPPPLPRGSTQGPSCLPQDHPAQLEGSTCQSVAGPPKVKGGPGLDATPQQVGSQGLQTEGVHGNGLSSLKQRQQPSFHVYDMGVGSILHEDVEGIALGSARFLCSERAPEEDFLMFHLVLVPEGSCYTQLQTTHAAAWGGGWGRGQTPAPLYTAMLTKSLQP